MYIYTLKMVKYSNEGEGSMVTNRSMKVSGKSFTNPKPFCSC